MTHADLETLSFEVINSTKPKMETENQSYFYGISKLLVEDIESNYNLVLLGTKEHTKKLMQLKLDEILSTIR